MDLKPCGVNKSVEEKLKNPPPSAFGITLCMPEALWGGSLPTMFFRDELSE